VNEKTHNFWAFKTFIRRLACVCEEYGIFLGIESEAWTSQTCPECGDHELSELPRSHRPKEERTDPQVASVGR
jgi:transposase